MGGGFEVNRGLGSAAVSRFRTGGQSGGKPEALRGHPGPPLSSAGASGGVERAIWGAARGDAGGFGAGRGLGRLVRGSDRAIESARGFATDTAARPARRPTPAPIASFRHCHRTTPPRGPELGKKHAKGSARSGARARRGRRGDARGDRPRGGTGCIRGRGDVHGAIPRVRSPQTPRQLRRGGLDHPSPHERTRRKPRKVNREKKVESRPWTLRAGDDARGSSTVTAVICAHLNEPE